MPLQSLLSYLGERGTLVSPDALTLLEESGADPDVVQDALSSRDELPFILTRDAVATLLTRGGGGAVATLSDGSLPRVPADASGARAIPAPAPADAGGVGPQDEPAASPTEAPAPSRRNGAGSNPSEAASGSPGTEAAPAADDADGPPAPDVLQGAAAGARPAGVPDGVGTSGAGADHDGGSAAAPLPVEAGVGATAVTAVVPADHPAIPRNEPMDVPELEPFDHRVDVLLDVTGESTCEGDLKDFTKVFNDRLRRLRKLLGRRREMVGMVPVKNIRKGVNEVKIVGLVRDVRSTRNGHRMIEVEDETGVALVLAPANDEDMIKLADGVIEDEVVGVVAKPAARGDLLILQDLVHPDVPLQRNRSTAGREVAACFVSDVHFGARTFLSEDWERFVRWINLQEGSPGMKRLARKTRYLVVVGDLVDGVGMFPGQEEELAIPDAYDQYRVAAEQLARIRDDVRIIVSPGNHDLVRPAEPQPALPPKYARFFAENVTQVGNPALLDIEGVRCLLYHGRSMDDWITRVQGLSYEEPLLTMKEMLRRRHLVPIYGLRTPIAPEHRDYLVIEEVPDVFVTGHVHAVGLETWRGVHLLNSSCWQSQTSYQKMHGFEPSPGRAGVMELDTGEAHLLNFHR